MSSQDNKLNMVKPQHKDRGNYSPISEDVNQEAEFINRMSKELHNDSTLNHK